MSLTTKNVKKARRSTEFSAWARKFKETKEGRNALDALSNLTLVDPEQHQELERALMIAAFHAASYMQAGDEDYRKGMDSFLDFVDSHQDQIKAIEILDRKVAAYPQWISLVFRASHAVSGAIAASNESKARAVESQEFSNLLRAYKTGLTKLIDRKEAFLHLHERVEGCLRYPANASRRRMEKTPSGALNSFLFEATALLRRWSLGVDLQILPGATMPNEGKPSYDIVAAFANAAFPEHRSQLSGSEVGDRLRKLLRTHPKITYMPWHDVNGNFEA